MKKWYKAQPFIIQYLISLALLLFGMGAAVLFVLLLIALSNVFGSYTPLVVLFPILAVSLTYGLRS